MKQSPYDIFIIGGGINGSGLARDAAGRGYKVALAEMTDLAASTSSASSKLIHGGLRYLEHHAFSLVRHALKERDVILRNAPHLVRPLRFLLPHHAANRPFWLIRLGLFLYDHLAKRQEFAPTFSIDFTRSYKNILHDFYRRGFEYSDGFVDDSRLVLANARHAQQLGADIMVGARVIRAQKARNAPDLWQITLRNDKGETSKETARYLVNMAGPYMGQILEQVIKVDYQVPIRLVKGSHIITKALYEHDRAYILQNKDGRIIFTIPYYEDFTLIGTTDIDYAGDPSQAEISADEISYLCQAVNLYFKKQIAPQDVLHSYCGIRPLYNDGSKKAQEATRDYILCESKDNNLPPLLNLYGGKITTYRKLSEDALLFIDKSLKRSTYPWTANVALPGGGFYYKNLPQLLKKFKIIRPELSDKTLLRLLRAYGLEAFDIFASGKELGQHFGHEFYEIELLWMLRHEWARTLEDVLWRRSKLGLYFTEQEKQLLQQFMEKRK